MGVVRVVLSVPGEYPGGKFTVTSAKAYQSWYLRGELQALVRFSVSVFDPKLAPVVCATRSPFSTRSSRTLIEVTSLVQATPETVTAWLPETDGVVSEAVQTISESGDDPVLAERLELLEVF